MNGSDIVRALIAKENAKRPLRALTKKESERLKRLELYLARLKAGEHVQNRTLQTWLTVDEYNEISNGWESEKEYREIFDDKEDEIKEYEERLNQGRFAYNRADSLSRKGKSRTAKKMFDEAVSIHEKALEYAQEIVASDPQLIRWFDRDVENAPHNNICPSSPVSMPHIVTSNSADNQASIETNSIADIKIGVVKDAIDRIKYVDLG
jgi:tetratricopeptide (TPR) repeat protein